MRSKQAIQKFDGRREDQERGHACSSSTAATQRNGMGAPIGRRLQSPAATPVTVSVCGVREIDLPRDSMQVCVEIGSSGRAEAARGVRRRRRRSIHSWRRRLLCCAVLCLCLLQAGFEYSPSAGLGWASGDGDRTHLSPHRHLHARALAVGWESGR